MEHGFLSILSIYPRVFLTLIRYRLPLLVISYSVRYSLLVLVDTCRCYKKFSHSERSNWKQHLLRHESVKPYVCSRCPKYSTVHELQRDQLVLLDLDDRQFCCTL